MSIRSVARSAWPWWTLVVLGTTVAAWLPLYPSLLPLFNLEGFADLGDLRLLRILGRTLAISAGAGLIAVVLGLPLALLATRTNLPGSRAVELLLPLPLFLPPLLLAAAWHGLTGMDGPWAAVFTLGCGYAPFPALLAARALRRQSASAHDAALMIGGRRLAIAEMLRSSWPAACLGGALAFLFTATDFAVPDYYGAVGDSFDVYANVVFNAWRDWNAQRGQEPGFTMLTAGTTAAAPLVLVVGLVFLSVLYLRDRMGEAEPDLGRTASRLDLGRTRWPMLLPTWIALGLLLWIPLGRIFYETGMAGPLHDQSWWELSRASFSDALQRGRDDLVRSLRTGVLAAGIVGVLAPVWADGLLRMRRGWAQRGFSLGVALPLLVPAVGLSLGAILAFNRDLFGGFYDSYWMPAFVMAGRFLPLAVFLLAERMQRVPPSQDEVARLAGVGYLARVFRYRLGPQRGAWFLAAGLVVVFSVRELDLAIMLPAANASAAVRYYNALHFARDRFVAAYGLLMALVLFLPLTLHYAAGVLKRESEA